jgi:hypothetical protein
MPPRPRRAVAIKPAKPTHKPDKLLKTVKGPPQRSAAATKRRASQKTP